MWQERHDAVVRAGGLHIVGTERHESRRIDNQLRGRSGRQGDPGSSRFFLSLEDDLMRIFAAERVSGLMQKLGVEEGEAIEHRWVTRAIENAQRKVEGRNFDIRKQLLEYDDVANDQRREIYALRDELMSTDDVSEMFRTVRADVVNATIDAFIPPESLDELWDVPGLTRELADEFGLDLDLQGWLDADDELHEEPLRARILDAFAAAHLDKEKVVGPETMRAIEKAVMLQVLDVIWKEHLAAMDYLRQGIHLRGYAQKNPKQEYKRESFEMFRSLLERFKTEVTRLLCRGDIRPGEEPEAPRSAAAAAARAGGVLARGGERPRPRGGDCRRDRVGDGRGSARGPGFAGGAGCPALRAHGPEGRAQRALPLRLGKKVQALPRPPALARKNRRVPAASANLLAVTRRTPSSRFDVVSTTPSASFSPCALSQRHLGALATKLGDSSGLAPCHSWLAAVLRLSAPAR